MKTKILIGGFLAAALALGVWFTKTQEPVTPQKNIANFTECANAGNPIMESYPRQCNANGKTYVENVETSPRPPIVGGDSDIHGCKGSAGYSWCETKQKCLRIWEEPCDTTTDTTADPTRPTEKEFSCPPKTGKEEEMACIALYKPVCATVDVQCFRAPCPPIQQTFGNSCEACNNPLVSSYTEGECAE